MNTKVAYIILHYNTISDTISCVESIRGFSDSLIVIVCNENDSDLQLAEKYNSVNGIVVLQTLKNEGFARGNDIGINYIEDLGGGYLIVCLNSDVLIKQNDFEVKLCATYNKELFALAGVDIVNPDGHHCNPRIESYPSIEDVNNRLRAYNRAIHRCHFWGGIGELFYLFAKRMGFVKRKLTEKTIMTLHGACVIFSPVF